MNQKEIARTFLCRNLQLTTTDTSSVLTASRIPPVRNSSYKKKKKNKEKKRFVLVSSQEIERQKKVLNDTILNKDGKFFLVYYCNCGAFNIRTFQESSLSIFRYRRVLSRLQNSPYFCVFKYARAVKQKVWNEATDFEKKTDCFAVYVLSAFPFTRSEAKQIYSDMCTHAKYVYVCMDAY